MHHIPNLLSVARLLLAPWVAWLIAAGRFREASAYLISAALTDAADGWLARQFRWTSQAGAYLDPIADKVLLVTAFVSLGAAGVVPGWFVWLVLARDLAILLFAWYAIQARQVRSLPPTVWGKVSTILQSLYVCWALLRAADVLPVSPAEPILLWAAVAGTLWSWADYTKVGLRILRRRD